MSSGQPLPLPAARYQAHRDAIDAAMARVFGRGQFILGNETAAFENEFAAFVGTAHCIGVASGTDALEIALRACGIGSGDAVLTVSHTAVATVAAIERAGATPVLVDIDDSTYTIDPERLSSAIREYQTHSRRAQRLKAIVPVHLYGQPADMPAILSVARAHELRVIEDCAQAHGASLHGRAVGTWGDLAAFSFYPTKNLGAFGDGGAVVTKHSGLAQKVRLLREYGWRKWFVSEISALNSRLDELQAAMLRVLLKHLPKENAQRREHAELYDRQLGATPLVLPHTPKESVHAFHQYVVKTSDRKALQHFLADRNIHTQVHYPVPIHRQPAYRGRLWFSRTGLPNTERVAKRVLSLPMSPYLVQRQILKTCEALLDYQRISRKR